MSDEPPPDAKCPHCRSFLCCGDAKDAAAYDVAARNACVQLGLTPEALEGGALGLLVKAAREGRQMFDDEDAGVAYSWEELADEKEARVKAWLEEIRAALAPFTPPPKEAPDESA